MARCEIHAARPRCRRRSHRLRELAEAENACTRCPLYKHATQAVPGEGRSTRTLMLVGEQPGDKEDLAGKPFVGPAGRVLDQALAEAGIPRGGFRHQRGQAFQARDARQAAPAQASERLRDRALQDLARSRTRDRQAGGHCCARRHRRTQSVRPAGHHHQAARTHVASADGTAAFVTIHPSFLLRIQDEADKQREYAQFRRRPAPGRADAWRKRWPDPPRLAELRRFGCWRKIIASVSH